MDYKKSGIVFPTYFQQRDNLAFLLNLKLEYDHLPQKKKKRVGNDVNVTLQIVTSIALIKLHQL